MKNIAYFFFLLLFLVACQKDKFDIETVVTEKDPVILVEHTVRGQVNNEAGEPVANAMVSLGNQTTYADADGNFRFQKMDLPKNGGIVRVEAAGYFLGSSRLNFTAEGVSYTKVTMLEKGNPQTFTSRSGASLTINGDAKISIPANSLKQANGNNYSGEVNLYARWLDPTDDNLGGQMPGALTGIDEEGNQVVLATYGMVVFELEAVDGGELELADGKEAEVELPIPDELLTDAPDEVPLWYFDLEEEQWLYQGVCKKDGPVYKCKTPKSGFWNCDVPLEAICLSQRIYNNDSTYASYIKVIIEDLSNNFIYWGYTDSTGFYCGSVPKDAPLRLIVLDLCDNIVYTEDIGEFSMDTQLPDLYLDDIIEEYVINITGTLLDCLGNPVTFGHIAISYPGKLRLFPLEPDGSFNIPLGLKCITFPDLSITGYDIENQKSTDVIYHNTDADLDLSSQTACNTLEAYFFLDVDTDTWLTTPTRFYPKVNSGNPNWFYMEALTPSGRFLIDISEYQGVGTYDDDFIFSTFDEPEQPQYPELRTITNGPDPLSVSMIISRDDGEYIEGTISGTMLDLSNGVVPVSGQFLIKK